MAVLMGSGMTVEQAWNRITARYLDERKNNDKNIMPAYEEMLVTEREISDGVTGRKAYAGFAERVKLPCYQKLVRIILQSIHKEVRVYVKCSRRNRRMHLMRGGF